MKVVQVFLNNSLRNFNYIIYSEISRDAIFVDPLDLSQTLPLSDEMGLIPKFLINTHDHPSHMDHFKDNELFLKQDHTQKINLNHEQELALSSSESIQCLFTPGHTPEHCCFLVKNNNIPFALIAGDTLFNAGVGNCKLGGDVNVLYTTTKYLYETLSDDIIIYPSHDYFISNLHFSKTVDNDNSLRDEYLEKRSKMDLDKEFITTTFGIEKKINPFLRVFDSAFKERYLEYTEKELFIKFRSLRDVW